MQIHVKNTQDDGAFGLAKTVVITSFRQVTIFGKDYTKIVYMHSKDSFSVEKVGDDVNLDENVQVISGPRAEEIITDMIKHETKKGSTFIWNGAHFKCPADLGLLKDNVLHEHIHSGKYGDPVDWDPLVRDPIETEEERKIRLEAEKNHKEEKRKKKERELDELCKSKGF